MPGLHHRVRRAVAGAVANGVEYTAKSVIIDIANNHSSAILIGGRAIEFLDSGIITNNTSLASFYATTSVSGWSPEHIFTTGELKTGAVLASNSWASNLFEIFNQRLICVFNANTGFQGIQVNNYHDLGSGLDRGMKDVKIYITPDVVTDTTYGASVPNGILIFDDTVRQHTAADEIDDNELILIP